MNTVFANIIMLIQVLSALVIIGLVLMQHGKGADMGAAFGSGASGSLFGATGSSNFLSKSTGIAAAIFFLATLTLAYLNTNRAPAINGGVLDNLSTTVVPVPASAPAASAPVSATPAVPAAASAPVASVPSVAAPTASAPAVQQPAKPASTPVQSNQIPK